MQLGEANQPIIPGLTKEHNEFYNMFIQVYMSNEKNIGSVDSKEMNELDEKLR